MGPTWNLKTRIRAVLSNIKYVSLRPFDVSTEGGRQAERKRRVALSAVAGLTVRALTVAISLLSVPLTISYLGIERYGLWLTVSSTLAMLAFADLGIGNGLLTEVAHAQGKDDIEGVRDLSSSAFASMVTLVLVLAGASYLLVPHVAWASLLGVTSPSAQTETTSVVITLLAIFIIGIPTSLAERIQSGCQMSYIPTAWAAVGQVASLTGLIVVTQMKLGLVPLVLCISGAPAFARLANSVWYFSGPGKIYRPKLRLAQIDTAKRLMRVGALFVVLQAAASFAFLSDNIVLANTFGADKVPELAVPAKLFNFLLIPVQLIALPLWPAYGEAVARGETTWAAQTLQRTTKLSVGFVVLAGTVLLFLGDPIIRFWTKGVVGARLEIMVPLLAATILSAWGTNVGTFLNGIGKLREQAISAVSMALGAFALKWILARHIGAAGIPTATVLAYGVLTFLPLSIMLRRMFATQKWTGGVEPPPPVKGA